MEYICIFIYCFNISYVNKQNQCFLIWAYRFSGYHGYSMLQAFSVCLFAIPEIGIFFVRSLG